MIESEKKREMIIERAMARFMHYGVNKTTMNEIAEDIAVTQSSLYYYFPDKSSLLSAVISRIFDDYNQALHKLMKKANSLKSGLASLVEKRIEFSKKFIMMQFNEVAAETVLYGACNEQMQDGRNREIDALASMFSRFVNPDTPAAETQKTATLYLDSITGLTMWALSPTKGNMLQADDAFIKIRNKMHELNNIFIKALDSTN